MRNQFLLILLVLVGLSMGSVYSQSTVARNRLTRNDYIVAEVNPEAVQKYEQQYPGVKSPAILEPQSSGETSGFQPFAYLQQQPLGYIGFDYAGSAFSPGTDPSGTPVYLCSGEYLQTMRALGITYLEGTGSRAFRRCWVAARNATAGGNVYVTRLNQTLAYWDILVDIKSVGSVYAWYPANQAIQRCKSSNSPPYQNSCPLMWTNYLEDESIQVPYRRFCKFTSNGFEYYGWTDFRIADDGVTMLDRVCYAVDTAGGRDPNQYKPLQWTGAFQLLGYKDTYLGLKRKLQPAEVACKECRARPNYPQQYFPGMYNNDIAEGSLMFAADVASCCRACQATELCYGFSFTAHTNWCWLKGSRVFEQNKKDGVTLNPPQSIEIAVSPPDPTGDTYCPAGQPASEYAYSAMLPATLVKQPSWGPNCQVQHMYEGRNWGNCGLALAVYATSLQECCEAVQKYNQMYGQARAYGFTFERVYNHCFLRDNNRCDYNGKDGWDLVTSVSAWLAPTHYLGPPSR